MVFIVSIWITPQCTQPTMTSDERELSALINQLEQKIIPLNTEANKTYYQASVSGREEHFSRYAELDFELSKVYSNERIYDQLKEIRESGNVTDTLLKRQLDILYFAFLEKQADSSLLKEIINLQTSVEKKFTTFRAKLGDTEYSDNQIDSILRNSKNSEEVERAWKAHKRLGRVLEAEIILLAKKRNELARKLGFKNFHEMKFVVNEMDPDEVVGLFNELDSLTAPTFALLKKDIDEYLASKFSLDKAQLQPWHYQDKFFQEGIEIYKVNFDHYYEKQNIEDIAKTYYAGIGLPVDDIMQRSDLYEKPGKNQHAFCTDIDREGDVRILCNLRNDHNWMNTLLHELGHGVYSKYHDRSLPYLLRDAAHMFTTEAIANFFGRQASNPEWMIKNAGITEEEADYIAEPAYKSLKLQQLIFSRWSQVMFRFEKEFYDNPDQDLNDLWWDLVEEYQLLRRPEGRDEPDWATKIHITLYPCYYHNYLMGELMASQISSFLSKSILDQPNDTQNNFSENPETGKYFIEKIFKPGRKYGWNQMIEKATGEALTAKYYAGQFIDN